MDTIKVSGVIAEPLLKWGNRQLRWLVLFGFVAPLVFVGVCFPGAPRVGATLTILILLTLITQGWSKILPIAGILAFLAVALRKELGALGIFSTTITGLMDGIAGWFTSSAISPDIVSLSPVVVVVLLTMWIIPPLVWIMLAFFKTGREAIRIVVNILGALCAGAAIIALILLFAPAESQGWVQKYLPFIILLLVGNLLALIGTKDGLRFEVRRVFRLLNIVAILCLIFAGTNWGKDVRNQATKLVNQVMVSKSETPRLETVGLEHQKIILGPDEYQKEIALKKETWSPWIEVPFEAGPWDVTVKPSLGGQIEFRDGTVFSFQPGEEVKPNAGNRRAIFRIFAQSDNMNAKVSWRYP